MSIVSVSSPAIVSTRLTGAVVNMMPLFHVGGIVRNLLAPIFSAGSTIMCPGFDPSTFWTLAKTLGATWFVSRITAVRYGHKLIHLF